MPGSSFVCLDVTSILIFLRLNLRRAFEQFEFYLESEF